MWKFFKPKWKLNVLLLGLISSFTLFFAYLHIIENSAYIQQKKWPDFDKESLLFSENAFYYSYFKRSQEANSYPSLIKSVAEDDKFSYPTKVNALFSFNIWPEVIVGYTAKLLKPESPFNFYVYFVGFVILSLFLMPSYFAFREKMPWFVLFATSLLLVNNVFFLSRYQHSPFQRENFGLPFFFLSILGVLSYLKREDKKTLKIIGIGTILSGIFWQFSVISFLLLNVGLIGIFLFSHKELKPKTFNILQSQFWCWILITLLMGLHPFYLSSLLLSLLVAFVVYTKTKSHLSWLLFPLVPLLFGNSAAHIREIFDSIVLSKNTFHSLLYSNSDAFRSLNLEHYKMLALSGFFVSLFFVGINFNKIPKSLHSLIIFPVLFMIPSIFLMRLSALAILSTVAFLYIVIEYFSKETLALYLASLLILFSINNSSPFERRDLVQNERYKTLVNDLESIIPKDSAIGADFTIGSKLALHLPNKFILHPQYESAESRRRNEIFNRIYAYYSESSVAKFLEEFKIDYLIVDKLKCQHSDFAELIISRLHEKTPSDAQYKFCSLSFGPESSFQKVADYENFLILRRR